MPLITLQQNMYSPITSGFHLFYYLIGMTDILFISPNQILYMFISCVNCLMLRSNNRSYALKQTCKFTYRPILQKDLFLTQDIKGVKAWQE